MREDLLLWANKRKLPFVFNSNFPINTLALQRGAVAFHKTPLFLAYLDAVWSAMWVDCRNLNDPLVIAEILGAIGISADDFMERISAQSIKDELKRNRSRQSSWVCLAARLFWWATSYFFGQDRLEFVADAWQQVCDLLKTRRGKSDDQK
jgi:2-hydroxychromene-2-carboxylate isomerase